MTSTPRQRIAVVGGGIAGLAAALQLSSRPNPPEVVVLESSSRAGGKLQLDSVAGVTVDVGAESMLATRPEAADLARHVGLGSDLVVPAISAPGLVLSDGVARALPPGLVLGIPGDLDSLDRAGVLSPQALEFVRAEANRPTNTIDADVSLGGFVRTRLGDEVVDRLIEPLLGGVYAGHADELSLQACIPGIYAAATKGVALTTAARELVARARAVDLEVGSRGSRGGNRFVGVHGGVSRVVDAALGVLAARGAEVRFNTTVRGLARTASGWSLTLGSAAVPAVAEFDGIVIATPGLAAARLVRDVASAAAEDIAAIDYASVAVITMAFRRCDVDEVGVDRSSGLLMVPRPDRIVKASTYSSSKWGWLAQLCAEEAEPLVILRASVGRFGEQHVLQCDDDELASIAESELRPLIGARADSIDHVVTRWGGSLPQYRVGHVDRVARIRSALASHTALEVAGAAYDGVGIAACIASGQSAATAVMDQLGVR